MLRLELKTKLSPGEVVEALKRYFGKRGLGLDLKDETAECLTFEGGGGYVNATLCEEKSQTKVDLTTQEWDYQVKQFALKLP
ncbi:MAG: hypothetical protein PVG99_14570 [Desulfobacteraceae bacterium]|jgi:hypothetical protein